MDLNEAERFVENNKNAYWEGWNLKIFSPEPNAWMKTYGSMYKGQWGFTKTIYPNRKGLYMT